MSTTNNRELATLFDQLADGLEIEGANAFRTNAYRRVARLLRDLGSDVAELVAADPATAEKRLAALPGLGAGAARRIVEYLETGEIEDHQKLLERVPRDLFEVLRLPGLGPKTVGTLWHELGITSIEELEARLDDPALLEVPRMGSKTLENIRQAIAFSARSEGRIPLGVARPVAELLADQLRKVKGVQEIAFAGSTRRGRDTVRDVDILVACRSPEAVRECFVSLPFVSQVLARGESRSSIRIEAVGVVLQADLRIVPASAWGSALLYFTGSKEHNVQLRQRAIRQDRHLNEFGLFPGTDERPQDRGVKPLVAKTEEGIYRRLGLPFVPPELREESWGLEELEQIDPDRLIELEDLCSELHSHTTASDGKLSIDQLAERAVARGYAALAITDHSQSSVLANGLSPDRLLRHIEAIREANDRHAKIELLAGAEVDILVDGSLDYSDDLLEQLDIVVASPHASLNQSAAKATERLVRAARHPAVDIIGHPTGRMVGRRRGLPLRIEELAEAAAECETALEINANWHRLDLRDRHVRIARECGCLISINTDAHADSDFDFLRYGVITARRGGLERERCINSWTPKRLRRWLERDRG